MQLNKHPRRDSGITLLELVIAVFVLALGSMAALRATDQSRLAIGGARDRMLAQLAAQNRAEELRLMGRGAILPDAVNLGGQSFALATEFEATTGGLLRAEVTALSQRGPGGRVVVYLTQVQR